jgi:SNF2 family DNA or RNA helicase
VNQLKTGQIVKIRNRLWRIDSIYKNELFATSIDSLNNFQKRFYAPLEEIKLAEIDIPPFDKVGELSKQQLLISAYNISLVYGTSPLLSLQRSSVVPTNYQLVPVVMALNSPRVRLLIADDVGLGKTIEAGLVINELIARQMVRKILIICPASLREQWQEALLNFFKLEFRIISSLHKKYLEKELPIGLSPWDYFEKLITSVDYAKSKANLNEIMNYKWDMVIVDEAHSCARPHISSSSQTATMQRWKLLSTVLQNAKHALLLTATPHNGYTDCFASLLEVLDVQATDKNNLSFIDRSNAKKHVCQRTRKDVIQWLKDEGSDFNPFPERDSKEVHIEGLSKNEVKTYEKLKEYGHQMMELVTQANHQYTAQFTVLHFFKRCLSSPHALRESLRNRIKKLNEKVAVTDTEKEIKENDVLSIITETNNLESISTEEAQLRIEHSTFGKPVTEKEIDILKDIYEDSKKIKPGSDSKYVKLTKQTIPELFGYANKIIVFTRYKHTLEYLQTNLEKDFQDADIFTIYGDMKSESRKEIFVKFEKAKKSVLIATDCISEGMNLQYLCSQIIHYELPWNPNRLEQRNGRVDRYGQPEETVHIRTMIVNGTLDEDILEKIIEKADRIKAEFGFTPPFFNDENDIMKRLIKAGKTPKTRTRKGKRIDDPLQNTFFDILDKVQKQNESIDCEDHDEQLTEQLKQIQNDSFYGQTEIRLPDIERKLRQTEKTVGSKEEIEKFIVSALKLFNCTVEKNDKNVYRIILNDKRLILPGSGDKIRNITFDKNYAARNPDLELLDLSHPFVSRLVQMIKQQMHLDDSQYGRTAYKISNKIEKPMAMLKVLVRYVVETEQTSVIEEILTIGFDIYADNILSSDKLEKFELSNSSPGSRTISEFKEEIKEVFVNKYWKKTLLSRIETERVKMIDERKKLIETLNYDELPSWLNGITNISYASHDIITVTIGYPA